MVFNFYLTGGFFLKTCTNLPWPVKNNFIPCGLSQEDRHCVMLPWGRFGHRRKGAGLQACFPLGRWFLYSDAIWSQGCTMWLWICVASEKAPITERRGKHCGARLRLSSGSPISLEYPVLSSTDMTRRLWPGQVLPCSQMPIAGENSLKDEQQFLCLF